jgi:hypothetical protein
MFNLIIRELSMKNLGENFRLTEIEQEAVNGMGRRLPADLIAKLSPGDLDLLGRRKSLVLGDEEIALVVEEVANVVAGDRI